MKFHEMAGVFPMMGDDEMCRLVEDIKTNGLLNPIWILEGKIIDGRNRWLACQKADVKAVTREYRGDNPLAFVIGQNLHRRHLSESQRAMVAARLANRPEGRPSRKTPQICAVSERQAAELLNVSERIVQSAKELLRLSPDKSVAVESGKLTVSRALIESKVDTTKERLDRIARQDAGKTDGVFDVVIIDPPWPVQKIERDCRPNQTRHLDYPTMTMDEIEKIKIPMADDCHVWLWTTHRFLPDAFRLLDMWGLKYSCCFVWHKNNGMQMVGGPKRNCEFVLYSRMGKPLFVNTKDFWCCFDGPMREHSQKPAAFYETVARVTAGRRLDMFCRGEPFPGFEGWGKESK